MSDILLACAIIALIPVIVFLNSIYDVLIEIKKSLKDNTIISAPYASSGIDVTFADGRKLRINREQANAT